MLFLSDPLLLASAAEDENKSNEKNIHFITRLQGELDIYKRKCQTLSEYLEESDKKVCFYTCLYYYNYYRLDLLNVGDAVTRRTFNLAKINFVRR